MISKEESNTDNKDIVLSDKEDKKPEVTKPKKHNFGHLLFDKNKVFFWRKNICLLR